MPHDLVIHTRRLLLRPLQPGDVDALFAVFSHPEVMRYWSTPPWTTPEPGRQMIDSALAASPDAGWLRLALVLRDTDTLVGTCSLFDHDRQSRRAQVGYVLARDAWGQGYAHEAVGALLDHAFEAWDLHRVEADVDPRNQASARLLERLGFQREGLLRERWIVGDEVSDTAWYGLLRREWRPMTAPPAA